MLIIIPALAILIGCNQTGDKKSGAMELNYPETPKDQVSDDYFGTSVSDPYRWLENDTAKDVEAWVKAENAVTFGYLNAIPFRSKVRDRYEELINYEKL